MKTFKTKIGNREIEFQKRNWARRASGEVVVQSGETQVLVTVVMEKEETDFPYFPLMVNYEERYYARGEIMGSRYVRREGKPTTNATLVARAIDRTIRPLFPQWMRRDIQVIATCLAWDGENDPDLLAMLGASFALHISPIPWKGPIGAVRVVEKEGKFLVNPTYQKREGCGADIIFCGAEKGQETVINMIEAKARQTKEKALVKAAQKAMPALKNLIQLQQKARKQIGREKEEIRRATFDSVEKEVKKLKPRVEEILFRAEKGQDNQKKEDELKAFKKETLEQLTSKYEKEFSQDQAEKRTKYAKEMFEKTVKGLIHEKGVKGERMDGRSPDEVREIRCEAGPVSKTHGSGIFSRGLTTSLSVLTLDGPEGRKLIEGMEEVGKKRFLHHYNFPPYSVGESKPLRAPGRRELGHGMLGEKALRQVLPDFENFSYTIRSVSEILSSNGSTSQSAICSTSLALMDAGVPIKAPVAGVALGLVEKDGDSEILTDIQGQEDFHGSMDLKVAGTEKGVTAIQMDVKRRGISPDTLNKALSQGRKARLEILKKMEKAITEPRKRLAPSAPKVMKTRIPPQKIGLVIGGGGKTIKKLTEKTGAEISIEDTGEIFITAQKRKEAEEALSRIKDITEEIEKGDSFTGKVTKALPFGVIVELCPGKDGLLHKSQYKRKPKKGEKLRVRVLDVDRSGKIDLALVRKHG